MAEIIEKFRVDCNGVIQDVPVCYQHLANKPEFKTINGKKIFLTTGDTETDLQLATNMQVQQAMAAAATAQSEADTLSGTVTTINNRVEEIEGRVESLEAGGGGSGGITVDATMSDTSANPVQNKVVKAYVDGKEAALESSKQAKLVSGSNIKTVGGISLLGSGNIAFPSDYYTKSQTYTKGEIDTKIASAGSGGTIDLSNYFTKTESNSRFALKDHNHEYATKAGSSNAYLGVETDYDETGIPTYTPVYAEYNTPVKLATVNDFANYYTKGQTYTQGEVNDAIDGKVNQKQDKLVSGTNIKTINNQSILGNGNIPFPSDYYTKSQTYTRTEIDSKIASAGSGGTTDLSNYVDLTNNQTITGTKVFKNIYVTGSLFDKDASAGVTGNFLTPSNNGLIWTSIYNYCYSKDAMDDLLYYKQNTLVSGTNIKTINGQSILGSGNITISSGSSPDLSDYYTKGEVDEKIAEISDDVSYIYEPITSEITLEAVDSMDCKPLYVKVEGTIPDGDKVSLGTFSGEYDIYLWSDNRVEVVSVMDLRQATTIETGILEIKFDALMDDGIIQPNWANQAYFVERIEEETKAPLGKDYGYTVRLERDDVEIDVNKVYSLNAIEWDHQLMPSFVLTDNGNPLEMDKIYTLKVLNFLTPQYTQEDYIDIAALFKIKLESGSTGAGTGEGRTFAWSSENAEMLDVGNCRLQSGFDISGVVEITFWTDDTASCYVLLSPFATAEW